MHNMTSTKTLPKKKLLVPFYGIVIAMSTQHMCDHVAPPSLHCKTHTDHTSLAIYTLHYTGAFGTQLKLH